MKKSTRMPMTGKGLQFRKLNSQELVLPVLIGIIGSALGLLYYFAMTGLLRLVWANALDVDVRNFSWLPTANWKVFLVTATGGLLVGVATRLLGQAGEIAAVVDNIHMEHGRIDSKQTPSMVIVSLISIVAGGSAGPEAPLVQVLGSIGSWVGDRTGLNGKQIRVLTFSGMAAALGAFFGAPLGGAIFALEIPHRRGIEYFEALLPSIAGAITGFLIFKFVLGFEGPVVPLAEMGELTRWHLVFAVALGVLGAVLAYLFSFIFKLTEKIFHPLHSYPILSGLAGGLAVGLIAMLAPKTMFWGEFQIQPMLATFQELVLSQGQQTALIVLGGLLILKMTAIGCTLHSGFRGGFIFPLFFIGAVGGIMVHLLFPVIPLTLAVICLMACLNVAITKTLLSTVIILATLTGISAIPLLITSAYVCFLLTKSLGFIDTQRAREAAIAP